MRKALPKVYEKGSLVWLVDKDKKFPGVVLERDCLLKYTVQIAVKSVGGDVTRQTVKDVIGSRLKERVA